MASSIPALAASLRERRRTAAPPRCRPTAPDRGTTISATSRTKTRSRKPARTRRAPVDREAVAGELARVEDFVARAQIPSARREGALVSGRDPRHPRSRPRRPRQRQGGRVHRVHHHAGVPAEAAPRHRPAATRTSRCSAAPTITTARSRRTPAGSRRKGATFRQGPGRRARSRVRLALVHEFRTRSKVLVCTEAGAKGLNLQFCETVINYDLPWNPQRIEQRIGRCHRYSQQRDVTVVNFIAQGQRSAPPDVRDPEPEARSVRQGPRRLGRTCCTSRAPTRRRSWCRRCRSSSRTTCATSTAGRARWTRSRERSPPCGTRLPAGRDAYEKEYERTSQIIESRFDEDVRRVFRRLREELPAGTRAVGSGHRRPRRRLPCARAAIGYERSEQAGRVVFDVAPDAELPAADRRRAAFRNRRRARARPTRSR